MYVFPLMNVLVLPIESQDQAQLTVSWKYCQNAHTQDSDYIEQVWYIFFKLHLDV